MLGVAPISQSEYFSRWNLSAFARFTLGWCANSNKIRETMTRLIILHFRISGGILCPLANASGVVCKILDYGGVITELHVPDRNGKLADVVLGYEQLQQYLEG